MKKTTVVSQRREQSRSERQAFIARIKKEMSELYGSFLVSEKEKQENFRALVADFTNKVLELYKDDLKVQQCS